MIRQRVQRRLRHGLKQFLMRLDLYDDPSGTLDPVAPPVPELVPLPAQTPSPGAASEEWKAADADWKAQFEQALAQLESEEEAEPTAPTEQPPLPFAAADPRHQTPPAESADGLDPGAVQKVFDEMVRPALQADGGDITLVKVENNDIYIELVGACQSCPSSVMTMKMGIERLLHDEFPHMGELIQVGEVYAPY